MGIRPLSAKIASTGERVQPTRALVRHGTGPTSSQRYARSFFEAPEKFFGRMTEGSVENRLSLSTIQCQPPYITLRRKP
ncbi:hypothetical protein [Methylocaldum marinum]|nr:hypothetical protein [Methylocaldum marinum]